jgi:hypothetical protein
MAGWWNWQTQRIQNPPPSQALRVQIPPRLPNLMIALETLVQLAILQKGDPFNPIGYAATRAYVQSKQKPAAPPKALSNDPKHIEEHQRKRHYENGDEAKGVVQRVVYQDPMRNRNLRAYRCHVCGDWVTGHLPPEQFNKTKTN